MYGYTSREVVLLINKQTARQLMFTLQQVISDQHMQKTENGRSGGGEGTYERRGVFVRRRRGPGTAGTRHVCRRRLHRAPSAAHVRAGDWPLAGPGVPVLHRARPGTSALVGHWRPALWWSRGGLRGRTGVGGSTQVRLRPGRGVALGRLAAGVAAAKTTR